MKRISKTGLAAAAACAVALVAPAAAQSPAMPQPPLPAPKQAIPRDPAQLATALAANTGALRDAVDSWRSTGDTAAGPHPTT